MNQKTLAILDFQNNTKPLWRSFQFWLRDTETYNPSYNTLYTWLHYQPGHYLPKGLTLEEICEILWDKKGN